MLGHFKLIRKILLNILNKLIFFAFTINLFKETVDYAILGMQSIKYFIFPQHEKYIEISQQGISNSQTHSLRDSLQLPNSNRFFPFSGQ